jgi:hypothetical protein
MTSLAAQLRLHGKIPHVEVIERSIAMQVRDAIVDRMKVMPFFQGFTFKRSHAVKVLPAMMPYCCVYFLGELLGADGDADIGEVRFNSVVRIGFSIMLVNNDIDAMEDRLDDAYQATFNGLLRDPTLYNNRNFKIQSFDKGGRTHYYGSLGSQNNETPYAELRAELHCNLGAIEYEPRVEDMLETIHVETVHPPGDKNNQHIFSVYNFDTFDPGGDNNGQSVRNK